LKIRAQTQETRVNGSSSSSSQRLLTSTPMPLGLLIVCTPRLSGMWLIVCLLLGYR